MAREIWVYPNKGPKYRRYVKSSVGREDFDSTLSFEARMRKNLYALECEQGSKFRIPDYDKKTLARAWNDNA
jgi:hypothetical protein